MTDFRAWNDVKNTEDDRLRRAWAAMVLRSLAEAIERGENPFASKRVQPAPNNAYFFVDFSWGCEPDCPWDLSDLIGGSE